MIDLPILRRTIEATPAAGQAAIVTRSWLAEVEREILDGRAAIAALAIHAAIEGVDGTSA